MWTVQPQSLAYSSPSPQNNNNNKKVLWFDISWQQTIALFPRTARTKQAVTVTGWTLTRCVPGNKRQPLPTFTQFA